MPGMTMTEKILAKHAGKARVAPGENVWVNVDVLMTHDVCGPGTIGIFHEKFGSDAKVWDPDRVVIIPDHYIFTADAEVPPQRADPARLREGAGAQVLLRPRVRRRTSRACPTRTRTRPRPTTRASATRPCRRKGTSAPARSCSAPTATPAPPARSASSPPASATPTRRSRSAPARPGSRSRRR